MLSAIWLMGVKATLIPSGQRLSSAHLYMLSVGNSLQLLHVYFKFSTLQPLLLLKNNQHVFNMRINKIKSKSHDKC